MSYFPSDPESWSESLTPPEGEWMGLLFAVAELDTLFFDSGGASIASRIRGMPTVGVNSIAFKLKTPLDITQWETLVFTHALSPVFNGNCMVGLVSQKGQMTRRFTTNIAQLFEPKQFDLQAVGWEIDPDFDPTQVTDIVFSADHGAAYTGDSDQWLDRIFFFSSAMTPFQKLTVLGVDVNGNPVAPNTKTIRLASGGFAEIYYLPFGPRGLSDGTWTVEVLDPDFVRWSDGDTNRIKTLTITAGGPDITLTVVYETTGEVPTIPSMLTVFLVAVFFGLILTVVTKR